MGMLIYFRYSFIGVSLVLSYLCLPFFSVLPIFKIIFLCYSVILLRGIIIFLFCILKYFVWYYVYYTIVMLPLKKSPK